MNWREWFNYVSEYPKVEIHPQNLADLGNGWVQRKDMITKNSEAPFSIVGMKIKTSDPCDCSQTQPIIREHEEKAVILIIKDNKLLLTVKKKIGNNSNKKHALIEASFITTIDDEQIKGNLLPVSYGRASIKWIEIPCDGERFLSQHTHFAVSYLATNSIFKECDSCERWFTEDEVKEVIKESHASSDLVIVYGLWKSGLFDL